MFPDGEIEDMEVDGSSSETHMDSEEELKENTGYVSDDDVPLEDNKIRELTFVSTEAADLFFKTYGSRMGFTTRRCHTGRKNGVIRNMNWECSCAGFRISREDGVKITRKSKLDIRCGCKVFFRVALQNGIYKVTKFESAHNHDLAKAKRVIPLGNKGVIRLMSDAGSKTSHIHNFFKVVEGPSNLSFTNKDIHNFLDNERKDFVKHGDATTTLYLLDGMKLTDVDFTYEKTVGEDGSVTKLFWADGLGRAQYKLFGDVIVFDITYKTNTYNFPLVILSGVDNNLKTCVFGGALINNETSESYIWLLETFLRVMDGQPPSSVITDQDVAMQKAIQDVFPGTKHRLCNWHLGRNCRQHVQKSDFCNNFSKLTAVNLSIDEFECAWKSLTEKHGVEKNPWVVETYERREMWAEAYLRGHFFGMMRSNQRAESMNSRFKLKSKQGYNLCEFLKQFFNDLRTLRTAASESQCESELPVKSNNRVALHSFVDQASRVYSKSIRIKVHEEIAREQALVVADNIRLPNGVTRFIFTTFDSPGKNGCLVEIDVVNEKFCCDCKTLESIGYPCCHLFAAFKQLGISRIPNGCIRERWTTKIGQQLHVYISNLFSVNDPQRERFMQLHRESVGVCLSASQSAMGTEDLMKRLRKAKKYQKDMACGSSEIPNKDEMSCEQNQVPDPIRQSQNYGIGNPSKSKPRGAPKNRMQRCGYCRHVGHKIGGCPEKKKSKDEKEKNTNFNKGSDVPLNNDISAS